MNRYAPGTIPFRAFRPKSQEIRELREEAARFTAILEYQLPLESRRADAIFLLRESIIVIELKGKSRPSDADIDQAHAYARDLRCYHAECEDRQGIRRPLARPEDEC